ncbi:MAG: DUF4157 domain-containing protein [Bacteroidales bacterium]|jgi:hypothetical protein|nr:DUF4157 domain-containing protein [Bacteroidales bacterium]
MKTDYEKAVVNSKRSVVQNKINGTKYIEDNRPESIAQRKLSDAIQRKMEQNAAQGKYSIQREAFDEEDMQMKPIQRKSAPDGLNSILYNVSALTGTDVTDAKINLNSSKPAAVQAHAYTQGTDIHVSSGQEKHIAHEAVHVAQQKQGRVQPTIDVAGLPVNDNPGLEREADIIGEKALKSKL